MSSCTESSKSWCFSNCFKGEILFEKDARRNIFYEEISLHLLDKPNRGKLTHCVKMEHGGEK